MCSNLCMLSSQGLSKTNENLFFYVKGGGVASENSKMASENVEKNKLLKICFWDLSDIFCHTKMGT